MTIKISARFAFCCMLISFANCLDSPGFKLFANGISKQHWQKMLTSSGNVSWKSNISIKKKILCIKDKDMYMKHGVTAEDKLIAN